MALEQELLLNLYDKKIVFLSPHFDDLAYSCSTLAMPEKKYKHLILLNIFTRSAYAPNVQPTLSGKISKVRAIEDMEFCKKNGFDYINLGYKDSSLRGYDNDSELEGDVFDDELFFKVKSHIHEQLKILDFHFLFCPLGLGNHIDHQIVYQTIRHSNPKTPVIFYEDLPYACKFGPTFLTRILKKYYRNLSPVFYPVSLEIKQKNMEIYASQKLDDNIKSILEYAVSHPESKGMPVERFWICKAH